MMKKSTRPTNRVSSGQNALYCFWVFLLLLAPMLVIPVALLPFRGTLFHLLLFLTGWFAWTFLEYIAHRFLMHTSRGPGSLIDFNHEYHHHHPTEIRITPAVRWFLLAGCGVLITLAVWMNNFFTLGAGFLCGFPIYTMAHFALHQKNTQKFLGKLARYHIYHHCKYPDKCFGISVTWWDDLFGTIPPENGRISERIIDFYFGGTRFSKAGTKKGTLLVIYLLLQFSVGAQQQSLHYNVIRNGNVIGYVDLIEQKKDNKLFTELKSEVKTRYVFTYSNFVKESSLFENQFLVYNNYYQKENGRETILEVTTNGNLLRCSNNGRLTTRNMAPVGYNYLQLFLHQPENIFKVYCCHYQQHLDLKKVSENKYRLTFPNGESNYYSYTDGVCTRVDVERSFFSIHFVLIRHVRGPGPR